MNNIYNENWYKDLKKAPWNPPNHWFGIVWSILYALMAISFFIVWNNKKCFPYCTPLTLFLIQLFFNLIWTPIFFRLRMPKLALLDLIIIIAISSWTTYKFYKISKIAGIILLPYLAWLCVALSLNTYIVLYN